MDDTEKPSLLMPVSEEHALRQFEIEALRQITDNLRRLNDRLEGQGKTLHSIDLRLTKIESNSVSAEVKELQEKVDRLESERDQRQGAVNLGNWMFRNWPGVMAYLAMIVILLQATGKIDL